MRSWVVFVGQTQHLRLPSVQRCSACVPTLLAFLNAIYEAKFFQFLEYWCNRTLGTFTVTAQDVSRELLYSAEAQLSDQLT
jgi:hypothetical protein